MARRAEQIELNRGAHSDASIPRRRPSAMTPGPELRALASGTERCYGAGGEEMAPSSLREPMECPDAPAERLEQVPRRRGPR
jgi:hypothetical protein